ncbi:MAG TPA: VCBS repeat-containing protein, partial [Terriglobales bacterium]|nr:VCBS repeat-containing protein [Terriglobales bacterium]
MLLLSTSLRDASAGECSLPATGDDCDGNGVLDRCEVPRVDFSGNLRTLPMSSPENTALGDFDGDGKLDIAVGSPTERLVTIFHQRPGRTFAPGLVVPGTNHARWIVAADFDRDGDTDLLTYGGFQPAALTIFRNQGNGVFTPTATSFGRELSRGVPLDLDRDGDADVLALGYGIHQGVYSFLNDGTGKLHFHKSSSLDSPYPDDFGTADLDKDGDTDAVLTDYRTAMLLRTDGKGHVEVEALSVTASSSRRLALADLDADLDVDLVVSLPTANAVEVYRNPGDGKFGASEHLTYPSLFEASPLTSVNLDTDRADEVLLFTRGNVRVLEQ